MKKTKLFLLFLLSSILFSSTAFGGKYLDLSKDGWSLGGNILLNLHITEGADVSLNLTVEPEISYLLAERFETFLNLKMKLNLLTTKEKGDDSIVTWGGALGPRYYFSDARFSGYLGASYSIELDNFRAESLSYRYSLEPGFIYGLNPTTAMRLGTPISVNFTSHHHFKGIDLQTGLLGVKHFIQ